MAELNAGIILSGRSPSPINALSQGVQAGQQVVQARRRNALNAAMEEHGPGALRGEENALAALARHDVSLPLGVQESRLGMEATRHGMAATDRRLEQQDRQLGQADQRLGMDRERLDLAANEQKTRLRILGAQEARAAEQHMLTMDEAQRAAEIAEDKRVISELITLPNAEEWDAFSKESGHPEFVGQFDNQRRVLAQVLDLETIYNSLQPAEEPAAMQTLRARAEEAGLKPGTPDYQFFMANGGGGSGSSAREEQIARIAALPDPNNPGQTLGRENAILFVDDIIEVSRNPRTEQAELIDTRTGGVWQGTASAGGQGTPAPQQGPQQGGGLTPGGGVSGSSLTAAPGQGTPQAGGPQLSYGDQFQNTQDSFGVEGFARRAVNTAFGAAGAEPPYPDVESTQAEFAVLKEFTTRDIANAYQRQPPARIMDNIQRLIPDAGRIFEGGSRAQSQLEALKQSLGTELGSVDDQLRNRQLSPDDRADLESQKTGLTNAMRRLDVAIQSFDRDSGGSGADANGDDAALINKWLED